MVSSISGTGASRSPAQRSEGLHSLAAQELRALQGRPSWAHTQAPAPLSPSLPVLLYLGDTAFECRPMLPDSLAVEGLRLGEQADRLKPRDLTRRSNRFFAKVLRAQVVDRVELMAYLRLYPQLWDELTHVGMPALLAEYAHRIEGR